MIYIKKIINNDLERTPTFNKESILDFFKIKLDNGENKDLHIKLMPLNLDFKVRFQKRNTRDEYRIFLNDLFKQINPKEEDILIFRKSKTIFTCEYIPQNSEAHSHLDHLFEKSSNHELIVSDNDPQIISHNYLSEFVEWLIENEGNKHNYLKDSFGSSKEKLAQALKNYQSIYETQFGEKVFSFPKSEIQNQIIELERNLYLEVGSFFEYSAKISNHMPRAILGKKNYINFLKKYKSSNSNVIQTDFNIDQFETNAKQSNLKYSNQLIARYVSSLVTKPFVLLSGLSGSGKTKLTQSFAQWICADEKQYCIVPVGADWTNREPLLGYVNALETDKYILPENGALQLIIEANKEENKNKPYFLILDEMNLSHVERYFADFLSVMESKDKFKLHSDKEQEKTGVPFELSWPKNLFVVGTVNIDETTYMFSPKVLDRANTIEFRVTEKEIRNFLNSPNPIDLEKLEKKGSHMAADFIKTSRNNEFKEINTDDLNDTLVDFFGQLQKSGAEFGYRTGMEIHRLYHQLTIINEEISENEKIDIVVMQKLLPKLHGSRRKLCPILETLGNICVKDIDVKKDIFENEDFKLYEEVDGNLILTKDVLYPLSLEKITRMYKGALDNGFASYAEA